jgi:hypothetical protein
LATHYPILHVVCHGKYVIYEQTVSDASGEVRTFKTSETLLFLEKHRRISVPGQDQSVAEPLKGSDLLERLGNLHGARGLPRFTFLASCETAVPAEGQALSGLAHRLVRELGMPAVLAMTEPVSVELTLELVRRFYKALVSDRFVDQAFASAGAVLAGKPGINVPVLYSRLGGRPLFNNREREPTTHETLRGLDIAEEHVRDRAPVLLTKLSDAARIFRMHLPIDENLIGSEAVRERRRALQEATDTVNEVCEEALDLRFDALVLGQAPAPFDMRCPFRGLLPFGLSDHPFFFGREILIKKLQNKLAAGNFLAVLRPSGSGKSSVVLAGLAYKMCVERDELAYVRPGVDPVGDLDAALNQVGIRLLVVDQFEQLFTTCNEPQRRHAFLNRLLTERKRIPVVVTMRADFWGGSRPINGSRR